MFDYHMHTVVSFDGKDTAQRMVKAALDKGLKEICFTDHVDDDPEGLGYETHFSVDVYKKAYDGLEADGLLIRRGMEFGLLQDNQETVRRYMAQQDFDFIIGSIHFVDDRDVYFQPYWEGKTQQQAERRYFEAMLECVQVHEDFDVLGHLTYISKTNANPTHRIIPLAENKELIAEIMKVLIAKGKGMEVNTSGVDRCGDFLPGEEYLRLFKDLGGKIVTVGSDAHTYDRVGQYADRACELVKSIFGHVCTFRNREPIFHK